MDAAKLPFSPPLKRRQSHGDTGFKELHHEHEKDATTSTSYLAVTDDDNPITQIFDSRLNESTAGIKTRNRFQPSQNSEKVWEDNNPPSASAKARHPAAADKYPQEKSDSNDCTHLFGIPPKLQLQIMGTDGNNEEKKDKQKFLTYEGYEVRLPNTPKRKRKGRKRVKCKEEEVAAQSSNSNIPTATEKSIQQKL